MLVLKILLTLDEIWQTENLIRGEFPCVQMDKLVESVRQPSITYSRVLKLDMFHTSIHSNEMDSLKNIDRSQHYVCFDGHISWEVM